MSTLGPFKASIDGGDGRPYTVECSWTGTSIMHTVGTLVEALQTVQQIWNIRHDQVIGKT